MARKKVLIVDDDEQTASLLERFFLRNGFAARSYTNPLHLVTAKIEADLLIVDYHMPYLTGADVMRLELWRNGTPVILITGDRPHMLPKKVRSMFKHILTKPFQLKDLHAAAMEELGS